MSGLNENPDRFDGALSLPSHRTFEGVRNFGVATREDDAFPNQEAVERSRRFLAADFLSFNPTNPRVRIRGSNDGLSSQLLVIAICFLLLATLGTLSMF